LPREVTLLQCLGQTSGIIRYETSRGQGHRNMISTEVPAVGGEKTTRAWRTYSEECATLSYAAIKKQEEIQSCSLRGRMDASHQSSNQRDFLRGKVKQTWNVLRYRL
jgi:hypothetical protein